MGARYQRRATSDRPLPRLSARDLAIAAGLLVPRGSTWQKGRCPTGCDGGDPRQSACSYIADGDGWHCWRCSAAGGADAWLKARGEAAELYAGARPHAFRPGQVRPRLNVAGAWLDLAALRPIWRARLKSWALDARGWPEDLAEAVADLGTVVYAPDLAELPRDATEGRALAALAWQKHRPVLIGIFDGTGHLRSAERRWTSPQAGPKSLALHNRDAGESATWPGGVRCFGVMPDAVRAAGRGEVLYLCEGAPDYAAAAALCRLNGSGAAVGACSAGELPDVARALADALDRTGVIAPRVVLVPHRGDAADVGARRMAEAADALRGRGGVYVARVPVDPTSGKGDLADLAKSGAAAMREVLDAAELLYPAPVSLAAARARLPALVADLVATMALADLVVLAATPGVGKSHALLCLAARLAATGRRVWIGTPTVAHANAQKGELLKLQASGDAPEVPIEVRTGRLRPEVCQVYAAADPEHRTGLDRLALARGPRAVCGFGGHVCPHAASCAGFKGAPAPEPGTVVICPHALLYRRAPGDCDLVVLDDATPRLDVMEVTREDLRSLLTAPHAAGWRRDNPEAEHAVRDLLAALDERAAQGADERTYPERPDLAALDLAPMAPLLAAALAVPDPPAPPASAAREHGVCGYPDPGAWPVLRRIADHAAGTAPDPEADRAHLVVRLDPDGGWALELRRPVRLPEGVRVLLLDATPGPELEAWARLNGRKLRIERLDVPLSPHVELLHVATKIMAGPRTRDRFGWIYRRTEGAVRRSLLDAVADLPPSHLGLIGFKAVAAALRGDGPEDCDTAAALAELRRAVRARGYAVTVGHYGAADRGINDYRGEDKVRALVLLGDPREDLGACEADVAAWGAWGELLDPKEVYAARTRIRAVQLLHRAGLVDRTAETPVRVVYVGEEPPDLGRPWKVRHLRPGPAPKVEGLDLLAAVRAHAAQYGAVSRRWLEEVADVSGRPILRALDAFAREVGWRSLSVKLPDANGRKIARCGVLAPNLAAAERYAAALPGIISKIGSLSESPDLTLAPSRAAVADPVEPQNEAATSAVVFDTPPAPRPWPKPRAVALELKPRAAERLQPDRLPKSLVNRRYTLSGPVAAVPC